MRWQDVHMTFESASILVSKKDGALSTVFESEIEGHSADLRDRIPRITQQPIGNKFGHAWTLVLCGGQELAIHQHIEINKAQQHQPDVTSSRGDEEMTC